MHVVFDTRLNAEINSLCELNILFVFWPSPLSKFIYTGYSQFLTSKE